MDESVLFVTNSFDGGFCVGSDSLRKEFVLEDKLFK